MHPLNSEPTPASRGVYVSQHRGPYGETVVIAIDSRGRLLYQAPVYREGTEAVIVEAVWTMLDAADPISERPSRPSLRLV